MGGLEGEYVRLGTNFEINSGGGSLSVVDSLGTSFDIRAHTVVVAGSESRSIAQAVDGDGVVRGAKADGTRVAGDATLRDIVRSLGTNEESITTKNGVGSECGSLKCWREIFRRTCPRSINTGP